MIEEQQHNTSSKPGLRRGKWCAEEELYTARIIHHFSTGALQLPEGTTLRAYLAEKLDCDPMRITKKFTGSSYLGKRVYHSSDRAPVSRADIAATTTELALHLSHNESMQHPVANIAVWLHVDCMNLEPELHYRDQQHILLRRRPD